MLKILGIIGLILIILLLLCLLGLVLILFVPVRYRIKAEYENTLKFNVRLTFLLRFFSFNISYDDVLKYDFRILFFKIFSFIDEEAPEEHIKKELKEKVDNFDIRKNLLNKEKIIKFFSSDNLHKIEDFFRKLLKFGKPLLPKKLNGRLKFGTGDIYTEGKYLSYLCLIYPLYAGKIDIIPVWEEEFLEFDLELVGKFTILRTLITFIALMPDKRLKTKVFRGHKNKKKVA